MKVAVIGIGQLGTELMEVLGGRGIAIHHGMISPRCCDVRYRDTVLDALKDSGVDWVINTAAAYTVDEYEGNPDEAFCVNASGAYNVASVAKELGIGAVYMSTNYVFGHDGPHCNTDLPHPLSIYGISKLAGEWCTIAYASRWFIIRTATLFGKAGKYNLVQAILRQRDKLEIEVNNLRISPSYAKDVAEKIVYLLASGYFNYTEHIVNDGQCTLKEFAEEIFRQIGAETKVKSCKAEGRDIAIRPRNGVLISTITIRPWQEALKAYLEERNEYQT